MKGVFLNLEAGGFTIGDIFEGLKAGDAFRGFMAGEMETTPGEVPNILGNRGLGEATGALNPGIGVLGLREMFLDLEAGGFTVGDRFGCFKAGDKF